MYRDKFGHLEHRHLGLATKHSFQRCVGIDIPSVFFVLKIVLLDVIPEFFGELATGGGSGTYHRCEDRVGLYRFHECGIWFALRFGLSGHIVGYGCILLVADLILKAGDLVLEHNWR